MTFDPKEARALVERLLWLEAQYRDAGRIIAEDFKEAAASLTAALDEIERLETQIRSLDHALNFILSDAAWTPKHPACESIIARINALRKGDDK